jgi:hypothetical protein
MAQEKQIYNFLKENIKPFDQVFQNHMIVYKKLINDIKSKSKNQTKTLVNVILPIIALYKTLLHNNFSQNDAFKCLQDYLFSDAEKTNKLYKYISRIPSSNKLFLKIFKNEVTNNDNWEINIIKMEPRNIEIDITKCLWLDACIENNCKELCKNFCDMDNIMYKDLKGLLFNRTGTMFYGNKCCDFKFTAI